MYRAHGLIVKLLNDKFGIQTRGGCSCAGAYGHMLLDVDKKRSYEILGSIRSGDMSAKPGWIRLSIHPTMTNKEIHFIMDAIESTACNFGRWSREYTYDPATNEYAFKYLRPGEEYKVDRWFDVANWR